MSVCWASRVHCAAQSNASSRVVSCRTGVCGSAWSARATISPTTRTHTRACDDGGGHTDMDLLDADAPGSSARAAFASASTGAASRARPPRAALRPLVLHEFGHKRGLEVHVSGFKWLAVTFHELGLLDDTAAMRAELGLLATRIAQDRAEKQATSSQSYAASQMLAGAQLVTSDTLIDAWRALQEAAQRSAHADSRDTDDLDVDAHIRVVSSFALPRYAFDVRRRTFVRPSGGPPSILARAASRPASVRERLEIMRAVVARDDHFQAPLALGASTDKGPSEFLSLSTTTDLAGRAAPASCLDGEGARNFLLLGLLTTLPDGRAAVEDLDGVVPLDLSQAQEGEGLFTHGAIVLLEGFARALPRSAGTGGVGNSGVVFVATQIGHPPAERREKSLKLYGHIDFLGTGVLGSVDRERLRAHERAVQDAAMARGEDPDAAGLFMVTMSDVRLDSDRDLAKLATVFEGFEYSSFIPRIIVLCGHFCSDTTTGDRLGRYKGPSRISLLPLRAIALLYCAIPCCIESRLTNMCRQRPLRAWPRCSGTPRRSWPPRTLCLCLVLTMCTGRTCSRAHHCRRQ